MDKNQDQSLPKEGDSIPYFKLQDSYGKYHTKDDFEGSPWILYFYPKDDTPGCTREACDFRDSYESLQGLNVKVVGVSKDSVSSHFKFQEKYNLPFILLSDPDGAFTKELGVLKEKSLFGKFFLGINRTTFLIGADQKIKKIYRNVQVRDHVKGILEWFKNQG